MVLFENNLKKLVDYIERTRFNYFRKHMNMHIESINLVGEVLSRNRNDLKDEELARQIKFCRFYLESSADHLVKLGYHKKKNKAHLLYVKTNDALVALAKGGCSKIALNDCEASLSRRIRIDSNGIMEFEKYIKL